MGKLFNLARMSTVTAGTGTITLGSAVSGHLTFANAGAADADIVPYGINDGSNSESGWGTYTAAGTTLTRNVSKSTNSNNPISLSGSAEVFITPRAEDYASPPVLRGYISGLVLSTAGSSATFGVSVGSAVDGANSDFMLLTSAYTKTTAAWAVGSGNGSFDGTGSAPTATAGWYHVYLIKRLDTGVVDILTSVSATSPTMPTNYTLSRRIGAMKTNGSFQWLLFTQDGNDFIWSVPIADIGTTTLDTTPTLFTLAGVPTGIKVLALMRGFMSHASAAVAIKIASPDEASSAVDSVVGDRTAQSIVAGVATGFDLRVKTDTSARVRAVSGSASTTVRSATYGWVDTRGRFS